MKKRIIPLLLCAAMIIMLLLLSACGEEQMPKSAFIDDNGNIVVVMQDGAEMKMGKVDDYLDKIGKTGNEGGVIETPTKVPKDDEPAPALPKIYVDETLHVIAEYDDGRKEDLGYVGVEVEVEPPMYTVTFVDASGKTLSTETIYRGKAATAPAAPQVADKIFDGWDVDFTNVQSDLTVHPLYKDMESHTVKFLDAKGNVIKTETVIDGRAATAPSAPALEGKVFSGWDVDFSNVRSDLTVRPTFREKGNYTVTFVDYSGRSLGSASVKEGENAKAPQTPTREGYTFTGWNPAITNVKSNITAVAQYKLNGGSNIIDVSYKITSSNTVKVTFTIKGTVKFAGCDIEVKFPSGLSFVSLDAGSNVVANRSGSSILFSVANTTNITSETVLGTATFNFTGNDATFDVVVTELFDQNQANVSYTVVGKKITLK